MIGKSAIQLPEKSAVLQNIDSQGSIIVQIINTKTTTLVIYPTQTITYTNSDVYVRTNQQTKKVRLQITPLNVVQSGGDGAEISGFLPLSGGTIDGNIDVNGTLKVQGTDILGAIEKTANDEDIQNIIDGINEWTLGGGGSGSEPIQTAAETDIQNIINGFFS